MAVLNVHNYYIFRGGNNDAIYRFIKLLRRYTVRNLGEINNTEVQNTDITSLDSTAGFHGQGMHACQHAHE